MKTKTEANRAQKNKNQKAYYRRHSEKIKKDMRDKRKKTLKKQEKAGYEENMV